MAKKNQNKDNTSDMDKLNASLAFRGAKPGEPELTIDQLIAEGEILLAKDAKVKEKKAIEPLPKSKDYYRQARMKLFKDMDPKKVHMLQKMEKEHDTINDIYQNFVDEVIKLGDKISDN